MELFSILKHFQGGVSCSNPNTSDLLVINICYTAGIPTGGHPLTDALFSFNDILMIVTRAPNIYLACFVSHPLVGVWDEGWSEGTGSLCNCSQDPQPLVLLKGRPPSTNSDVSALGPDF